MHPDAQTPDLIAGRIARFALGPFATNCYVLPASDGSKACWLIDAGFAPEPMIDYVREHGLTPELIVLTHAHLDHIAGLETLREAFPGVPVLLNYREHAWLDDPELNLSNAFGMPMTFAPADRDIRHGDELTLAGESWTVLHTPGHSPGSVSLHNTESGVCFAGDTLFLNSIGRFDFPTSDGEGLFESIRTHLYAMPDETVTLPGHGPETTIGHEKRTNPFVRPE